MIEVLTPSRNDCQNPRQNGKEDIEAFWESYEFGKEDA